ncbi:MAG: VWA domain-containing protein [Deltaproteobacteria bacterium]|nr:VWA domain-containing protein [Deltaproteobacteria bacterium]
MRRFSLLVVILGACSGRKHAFTDGGADAPRTVDASTIVPKVVIKDIPLVANRALDLLFVVDDSGSMAAHQNNLVANVPRMIDALTRFEGGLPDLHVGVVSSDMGAGLNNLAQCTPTGDAGHLLQGKPGTTCAGLDAGARFIDDVRNADGTRTRNYTGELAPLFACMAAVGTTGCGLESHLESMRAALDPATAFNAGFLRADAALGIVILGDEDDCSAGDPTVFDPTDSAKGPINLRCTTYGIVCDGDDDPAHLLQPGVRTNCRPREDSAYLYPVARYVDFVRGLKADPRAIVVGDIGGPPTPVEIGPDPLMPTDQALLASCASVDGTAKPDVRRGAFASAFGARGVAQSICTSDLSDPVVAIAEQLKEALGDPCLGAAFALADRDPATAGVQPDCAVTLISGTLETGLPACAPDGPGDHTNTPCWYLVEDAATCSASASHLRLRLDFGGAAPAAGARVTMACALE